MSNKSSEYHVLKKAVCLEPPIGIYLIILYAYGASKVITLGFKTLEVKVLFFGGNSPYKIQTFSPFLPLSPSFHLLSLPWDIHMFALLNEGKPIMQRPITGHIFIWLYWIDIYLCWIFDAIISTIVIWQFNKLHQICIKYYIITFMNHIFTEEDLWLQFTSPTKRPN